MSQTPNASLSFEPVSATVKTGDIIPVDVLIYSEETPVVSSDIWITYDPSVITLRTKDGERIESGDLFQTVDAKEIAPGKLYLYAINRSGEQAKATNGNVATIYFQAASEGNTMLQIACSQIQEQSSQIITNDDILSNVIDCDSTRTHTASIQVTEGNVLGITDSVRSNISPWYVSIGILLAILLGILFLRYKKFRKDLKIEQ